VQLERLVDVVINWQRMAIVQVFELPLAEPDVVLFGDRAIFQNFAHCNGTLKNVEQVARV